MPGFAVSFVVTASSASQGIEAHADDRRYQFHGTNQTSRGAIAGNEEVAIVGEPQPRSREGRGLRL
jgi:hypothetical protein